MNACDIILTAVNVKQIHWCLAVSILCTDIIYILYVSSQNEGIDKMKREIFYLDPLGGKPKGCIEYTDLLRYYF